MKAVLALAFLAVAQAYHHGDALYTSTEGIASVHPTILRSMFLKYGLQKPALDADFASFAKSSGASDYHLHSLYDQPAALFFVDPTDNIVSYYADAGVSKALQNPEMKAVLPSVMGAADSMAIVYQPESFLGPHQKVLSGRFFVPSATGLAPTMRSVEALPIPIPHAIFKKAEIPAIYPEAAPAHAKFNIENFPVTYNSPVYVSLPVEKSAAIPSASFFAKSAFPMESSHIHPIFAKSAYPVYKSNYPAMQSEIPSYQYKYVPNLASATHKQFVAFEPAYSAGPAYKALPYSIPFASVASISPIAAAAPEAFSPAYKALPYSTPFASVASITPIAAVAPEASSPAYKALPYSTPFASVGSISPIATLAPEASTPTYKGLPYSTPFASVASISPVAATSSPAVEAAYAKGFFPIIQSYADSSANAYPSYSLSYNPASTAAPAIRVAPVVTGASAAPMVSAMPMASTSADYAYYL